MLWTVLRQPGIRVTEGPPPPTLSGKVFWRPSRDILWASEISSSAVSQGLPWRHIWAPVLLLERVPGVTVWVFLYSFMHFWHILTKMKEHSMFYHSIPSLFFAAYFLMLPLKFLLFFAFLADKNPRFPICCLLGWLYGSNEGQQPQVWTQILLLIPVSRARWTVFPSEEPEGLSQPPLCTFQGQIHGADSVAEENARWYSGWQYLCGWQNEFVAENHLTVSHSVQKGVLASSSLVMPAGDLFSLDILHSPEE